MPFPSYLMYRPIYGDVLNEKLFSEPTAPFSREFPLKFLITPNNGTFFQRVTERNENDINYHLEIASL